ncbi:site-specific DNA-methyltransferase [Fibrobacter sp. UWB5]|uniref:site-specific DNA-methyltransferase n=1 Tax=Fibrobacter sp. UWB5 TaxID=1964360 RepID=UPI000B527F56|nr:site-specific DNA-methyltransferase [Fibrobacter sp. UWB5]OWV10889.1 hypothetical protein B7989_10575 [Fibrobacter sp. UWB5]
MLRNSFIQATAPKDEKMELLKQAFPDFFKDGKIDINAVKDFVGEENFNESDLGYGLYWPGKREAKILARKPAEGTLKPVVGDGVDEENTKNIYIEGDNLEVLRCLKNSYKGRVKMIYIDPPYNTGKDFIYRDKFEEPVEDFLKATGQMDETGVVLVSNPKSNGAYHRRWLNMMYSRLQLARELLTKDGVIFISIDDNELANLKLLCDEIFGEANLCGQWNWFKSATPPNLSKKIKKNVEYILAYHAGENDEVFSGVKKTSSSNDPITKPQNTIKQLSFKSGVLHTKLPDGIYKKGTYGTDKFPNTLLNDLIVKNGVNQNDVTFSNKFIWVQEKLDEEIENGTYIELSKSLVISYKKADYRPEVPPNFIDDTVSVDTTENAGTMLTNLFGGSKVFDYPKPISLIAYLTNFFIKSNENAIIVDFFSGSATAAHAIMQLNADDLGNRKFIMVQLPVELSNLDDTENEAIKFLNTIKKPPTICEIGKERIRRAGKKILEEHPELKGKIDVGFKVYREAKSNLEPYKPVKNDSKNSLNDLFQELEKQVTPLRKGWTKEGLLTEIMLRQGFALDSIKESLKSLKKNDVICIKDDRFEGRLIVCLDDKIHKDTILSLQLGDDDLFVCLDSAIDDENYCQLSDKGRIATI